jgi:hypothetical protein
VAEAGLLVFQPLQSVSTRLAVLGSKFGLTVCADAVAVGAHNVALGHFGLESFKAATRHSIRDVE